MPIEKHLRRVLCVAIFWVAAGGVASSEVKLGFLGGFTGPVESLAPNIYESAKLAAQQINTQGGLLDGETLTLFHGDTTCAELGAAYNAATQLIDKQDVIAVVGALCSGATLEAAKNVAIPRNVVMLTPASTSPALTKLDDKDLIFRSSPSDAYQGQVMARLLVQKGIKRIAITYVNNDYGKGFSAALSEAFLALDGRVFAAVPHEENRPRYTREIELLANSGAITLVVLADAMTSGTSLLGQAIKHGTFVNFVVGDRMVDDSLITAIGANRLQFLLATKPVTPKRAEASHYREFMREAGHNPDKAFAAQAYDAAFLLALAIEKSGKLDRASVSAALRQVASAPGEVIIPGEWGKAKALLARGRDINYQGAGSDHEFDQAGDVPGIVLQMGVSKGKFVAFRQLH